jgi:hypothetical protein
MDEEGVGKHIAKKTKARHDRAKGPRLRDDVGKLDFKKVSDSRPLHQHRTGQRMNKPRLDGGEVRRGHTRLDLPVKCIAGFQGDLFALVNLSNWGDVGVITVVADMGLFGQRFASIDADRVHACLPWFNSRKVREETSGDDDQ